LFTDTIETDIDIYGAVKNLNVGAPYEIQCNVYTDQLVHSDLVNITWIGPNNNIIVTDNRINVIHITSNGNNHTSTLQFLYLSHEDEGLYTCNIAVMNSSDSESFELKRILSKLHILTCMAII